MFKIAIIDDDQAALSIVSSAVESFFNKKNIEFKINSFPNPINYLATIKEEPFNLIFLDIDMPEKNGLDVAKATLNIAKDTQIIFLSQREDLVFECLAVHPFGFIRKSNLINDFSLMMNQYYDLYLTNENDDMSIKFIEKNKTLSFKVNDIAYISSDRNYQDIVLGDKRIETVRVPFSTLEGTLKDHGFIRIHKCYMVNYLYIRSIHNDEVVLTNGVVIPLSKKRKEDIMRQYLAYSRSKNMMII